MAPHSSTLTWKIPWMEEPGRLRSMGSLRVGHDFTFTFTFHFHALEKEMATHSSVLAWRIPGMGEPGGLTSTESHRVGHDWSDLAAVQYLLWHSKYQIIVLFIYFFFPHGSGCLVLLEKIYLSPNYFFLICIIFHFFPPLNILFCLNKKSWTQNRVLSLFSVSDS